MKIQVPDILEQVVVLSRHGIRSPLPQTKALLETITTHQWMPWQVKSGYLTQKGGLLEAYFGAYFRQWLDQRQLITLGQAISGQDVFVYSNSLQRTVATAQYFSTGAFAGEDVTVKHRYPIERMDPIFNPQIRDSRQEILMQIQQDIASQAGISESIERLNDELHSAYQIIEKILNYSASDYRQKHGYEQFIHIPTSLSVISKEQPDIYGPINIATAVADAFILQYYEGVPESQIAWGNIQSQEEWKQLADIKNRYMDILFQSPFTATHLAMPLMHAIDGLFNSGNVPSKFTFLVGHDSNIASLLTALKFSSYQLPGQLESTPIGGKVVLQRWRDSKTQQVYFKAEYIYQTMQQIRQAEVLDLQNPPHSVNLLLSGVSESIPGFYHWQDFTHRLKQTLQPLDEKVAFA
ncbi:histidine-type phosphatase [Zophobihabitans entericus]|uniref:Histidine-type phosphatase n=1 Tax=Zophobihabitans entericus TaxID=1635327 RepID=A0A6G9I9Z1_9GAMM|nr:histidine-type phosphatase [Zophobihabitans entericus]QIQ21033.1 histidine-type phosphatase [Zophobihabitans entericus]